MVLQKLPLVHPPSSCPPFSAARLLGYKGGRRDKATAAAAAAGDDAAEGVALEGGAERGLGGSGGADDVAADVDEELDLGSACTHNKHVRLRLCGCTRVCV
jgi:hypothetical protein